MKTEEINNQKIQFTEAQLKAEKEFIRQSDKFIHRDLFTILYRGLWTPQYLAEKILFPKPISVNIAEIHLTSWAIDLLEENTVAFHEWTKTDEGVKAHHEVNGDSKKLFYSFLSR